MHSKFNIVYKEVGDLDISLDIHVPENAEKAPVLVWFHGFGGLLSGHRNEVPKHMLESVDKWNHVLITADYRLAPQVNAFDILGDVTDCIEYIRSPKGLITRFKKVDLIDTSRIAVSGSSAGGFLALLAGLYSEPKPKCILALYPITDPFGSCFTESLLRPEEERELVTPETVEPFLNSKVVVANSSPTSIRRHMFHHTVDYWVLPENLGLFTGADALYDEQNNLFRVAKQIDVHGLPPTYLCHGSGDVEVGVEQSDVVVGVMAGVGITYEYDRMHGRDHMFDVESEMPMLAMYEFMHRHV
jgi:acetyl esterase/lipase